MPTYGYQCLSCDNQFEIFQSIKDDALTTCDTCGGTLRKRVYPVGIAFKGSGFYVNDYAPKAPSSSSASSDPTAPETAKSETAKSETAAPDTAKPEGIAASKPEPVKAEVKTESKSETKAPATAS